MTMGLLDGDSRGGSRSSSPTRAARRLTRRYLLFAAVLISVCTCFFMFRDTAYEGFKHTKASLSHYAGSGPEDISASDTKSSSELAWEPSEDWDPTLPIYDDFESSEPGFGSHANDLELAESLSTPKLEIYHPYPKYHSPEYKANYSGAYVSCIGPRGKRLEESPADAVSGYDGIPKNFPEALLGNSQEIGIDQGVCFDRFGRFGAYGLDRAQYGHVPSPEHPPRIDFDAVDWGSLQAACVAENQGRFDMSPRPKPGEALFNQTNLNHNGTAIKKKRSAVLFRSYDGMKYTQDQLRTIRSIIQELALASGGEYEAFLLVHVKDNSLPIFDDPEVYEIVRSQRVPKEFRNITVLWNEGLWSKLYPLLPSSSTNVHISQWLPIQWFAQKYPNFDHYWNWEMDIRYTGHHYDLLEGVDQWTRQQPRKGLWERNARFYIPSYHGSYSNFTQQVQARYQSSERWRTQDTSIWGPNPPEDQKPVAGDISPPATAKSPSKDDYQWGVGEDADLITMLPMFNPDTSHYAFSRNHYNYPLFLDPAGPARRTTIITFYRLSHRLLSMMHDENSRSPGHHMSSETWPQSTCLHHGLKAVYAPHSIFMERHWPGKAADFIFNNGDRERIIEGFRGIDPRGEGSGGWESVFGLGREHNFDQSTWYYRTRLATRLYKRFLGHEVDGMGGEAWEEEHGTYCLPPILLHQIKDIQDPLIAHKETPEEAAARIGKAEAEAKAYEDALQQEIADARKQESGNEMADASNTNNQR